MAGVGRAVAREHDAIAAMDDTQRVDLVREVEWLARDLTQAAANLRDGKVPSVSAGPRGAKVDEALGELRGLAEARGAVGRIAEAVR